MSEPISISVALKNLYLDPENPRFDPVQDEAEAIAALCASEQILAVAESVAQIGLNPLELTAVTSIKSKDGKDTGNYIVHEGNRRVCALKLIVDPEKAPTNQQGNFRSLPKDRVPNRITVVLFEKKEDLQPWVRLLHLAGNNPSGRRKWNAEQQAREFGETRNQQAVTLTDWAEENGLIKKEARKGTTSTIERWINNAKVKAHLGIKFGAATGNLEFIEPKEKAVKALRSFFEQVLEKKINTRANKKDIEKWVVDQTNIDDQNSEKPADETQNKPKFADDQPKTKSGSKPVSPKVPKYSTLPHNQAITDGLSKYGNQKLRFLYHELCTTKLSSVQLLCIGWWAFLETLCVCAGMTTEPKISFSSFLSKDRLDRLGFTNKSLKNNIWTKIDAISTNGNMTKHAKTASMLNEDQLYNDVQTIEEMVVHLLEVMNGDRIPNGNWP